MQAYSFNSLAIDIRGWPDHFSSFILGPMATQDHCTRSWLATYPCMHWFHTERIYTHIYSPVIKLCFQTCGHVLYHDSHGTDDKWS